MWRLDSVKAFCLAVLISALCPIVPARAQEFDDCEEGFAPLEESVQYASFLDRFDEEAESPEPPGDASYDILSQGSLIEEIQTLRMRLEQLEQAETKRTDD